MGLAMDIDGEQLENRIFQIKETPYQRGKVLRPALSVRLLSTPPNAGQTMRRGFVLKPACIASFGFSR